MEEPPEAAAKSGAFESFNAELAITRGPRSGHRRRIWRSTPPQLRSGQSRASLQHNWSSSSPGPRKAGNATCLQMTIQVVRPNHRVARAVRSNQDSYPTQHRPAAPHHCRRSRVPCRCANLIPAMLMTVSAHAGNRKDQRHER